jgi:L-glyceraldehyde 3-phosphate reductase
VKSGVFLQPGQITPAILAKIQALNEVARARGSTLAQLATNWLLRSPEVTTVLIGASKVAQIDDIHAGLRQPPLAAAELARIESILAQR